MSQSTPLPEVVSRDEWLAANAEQIAREKAHTRERDALNAQRRRQPMWKIDKSYEFDGPDGKASLLELFGDKRQLLLYHFMLSPDATEGCDGCSMMVDNMCHPAHLHARDVNLVLVSRAPLDNIQDFNERMGWNLPWYSSYGTDFNHDLGVGPAEPQVGQYQEGEMFGMSVFLRDEDDNIYQTYFTQYRGVEYLGSVFSYLDLLPYGRGENWEDSPEGWPKSPPYEWWRLHDRYDAERSCHCK